MEVVTHNPPSANHNKSAQDYWSHLPDDLLLHHVLMHLSKKEAGHLRAIDRNTEIIVNKTATSLQIDPTATSSNLSKKFPYVTSLSLTDSPTSLFCDDDLKNLTECCSWSSLSTLDIKACRHLASTSVRTLLSRFPTTRTLRLSRWTDDLTLHSTTTLCNLQSLDLGDPILDIRMVTNAGLAAIARHTCLTSLNLERCTSVTDAGFSHLAACTALRHLNLSRTLISAPGLAALSPCTALHTLLLPSCRKISDEALATLPSFPSLNHLDLTKAHFTNEGLTHLASLRILRHLTLGNRCTLLDTGLLALSCLPQLTHLCFGTLSLTHTCPIPALPALQSLTLGGIYPNRGTRFLFPLPQLRTLHIRGLESSHDGLLEHAATQTQLTSLKIAGGYLLTNQGLRYPAQLSSLQALHLSTCPHITSEGLAAVTAANQGLTSLRVWQCSKLPVCCTAEAP